MLPLVDTLSTIDYNTIISGDAVADIIRMGKGHTEGLEPRVTEAIVEMMMAVDG